MTTYFLSIPPCDYLGSVDSSMRILGEGDARIDPAMRLLIYINPTPLQKNNFFCTPLGCINMRRRSRIGTKKPPPQLRDGGQVECFGSVSYFVLFALVLASFCFQFALTSTRASRFAIRTSASFHPTVTSAGVGSPASFACLIAASSAVTSALNALATT